MLPTALIVNVQSAKIDLLEPFFYVGALYSASSPFIYSNVSTEPVSPGVTFFALLRTWQ